MSVEAVVFDADGVLVFPWRFAEHLRREHQITDTQTFFSGVFNDCLVGKADLAKVLPPHLAQWGWGGSTDEFMQMWFSVENAVDERALNVVRALRATGLVCGLASNQERYRAEYMRTVMGFDTEFDALFFSGEMGVKKPDAKFYERVEAMLGLPGEQIAFWDDTASHVDAAKRRGWSAELFTSAETLELQAVRLLERNTAL